MYGQKAQIYEHVCNHHSSRGANISTLGIEKHFIVFLGEKMSPNNAILSFSVVSERIGQGSFAPAAMHDDCKQQLWQAESKTERLLAIEVTSTSPDQIRLCCYDTALSPALTEKRQPLPPE